MLNAFLMSVYNLSDFPTFPVTNEGLIVLESGYQPYTPTSAEQEFLDQLYHPDTGVVDNYTRFCRALQVQLLVEITAYGESVTSVDSRISFTHRQSREHIITSQIGGISQILQDTPLELYARILPARSVDVYLAQASADRYGLLLSHFGTRAWL